MSQSTIRQQPTDNTCIYGIVCLFFHFPVKRAQYISLIGLIPMHINIPSLFFLGGLRLLLLIFNDLSFDYLTFILNDEQLGELEMNYPSYIF